MAAEAAARAVEVTEQVFEVSFPARALMWEARDVVLSALLDE